MITSIPFTDTRWLPIAWTEDRLGIPRGFSSALEWRQWVNNALEESGLIEEWIISSNNHWSHNHWIEYTGYFAYQEGYCIHHKGKVLDIQMLVLSPHCKETRQVWKSILESAKRNGYSWVARRQHQPDGSIKTIFTEV